MAGNVRATRLHLVLTTEELVERANLDVLTLDDIEHGEGWRVTMLGLGQLGWAFGTPADELLSTLPPRAD